MVAFSLDSNSFLDKLLEPRGAGAVTQGFFQINLVIVQKAGSQLTIGGEAEAITAMTEMLSHRADETDGAFAPGNR